MSKTALTALLIVAGVVIVALVGMMTMGGGMMGGMMGGPGGMMTCPMWVFGWIIGIGLIALIIFAVVRLAKK
jgi:hypothetical protein